MTKVQFLITECEPQPYGPTRQGRGYHEQVVVVDGVEKGIIYYGSDPWYQPTFAVVPWDADIGDSPEFHQVSDARLWAAAFLGGAL